MTELVTTNPIETKQHQEIGRNLLDRVREMISGTPEIQSYTISAQWRYAETITLVINDKVKLTIGLETEK